MPRLKSSLLRTLGLLLATAAAAPVSAQAIGVWDLDALVRHAAQQHPAVRNAQQLIEVARADQDYAHRQRYPELSVSSLSQSKQTSATLVIKQPLWAGGAIEAAEAVASATLDVGQASAAEQQLTIALRVLEAWRNYLVSSEKLTVIDQGIVQLQELVAMIQRRVDAQVSPRVELDLAQARVIQAQIARATLVAERDLALLRLRELAGVEVLALEAAAHARLQPWRAAIARRISLPTEAEMEQLAQQQPTVRRVRREAVLALREIDQAQASQWPNVFLQYQRGINQDLANDRRVGLAVEYSPGRGFSSQQKVQGAVARAQARDINVQTAVRDARDSLNAKRQEMARTQALEQSWRPSVDASTKLLASYQRQFIAGRKSWQDVLGQQNELMQAQQSLAEARIRWVGAYAELQLMVSAATAQQMPAPDWLSAISSPTAVPAGTSALAAPAPPAESAVVSAVAESPSTLLPTPLIAHGPTASAPPRPAPASAPADAKVQRVVWQADALFDGNGAMLRLSTRGRAVVQEWLDAMRQTGLRAQAVSVTGFSDALGSPAEVRLRSQRMSILVLDFIRASGWPVQQWRAQWRGASQPVDDSCGFVASVRNVQCHRVNRRIEAEVRFAAAPQAANDQEGKR